MSEEDLKNQNTEENKSEEEFKEIPQDNVLDDGSVIQESEENIENIQDISSEISDETESDEPVEDRPVEILSDEDFKWYAVRIISGHENKVKKFLDKEIKEAKLEDKIRNVLIPLEKVFEVKGGKKKIKLKNFLPGYILIEANLTDKVRKFISTTPSILNMVGSKSVKGDKLAPIPLRESELKRINAILNEENETEKIDFQLQYGDPVKVTSGPFNNFSGTVFEVNMEKMKVKVMVSIFGRKTPIELEFTQVEKEK
jgi:transcriptional antiterminator NusG